MSDVNSDNIWDVTIPLNKELWLSRFSDSQFIQETRSEKSCTNGDSTYTNEF